MSGTDNASGDTPNTLAKEAVRSAFGVLAPVSYCASRTSADFSGKPSSIPRYFCVMPRIVRKKWILSPIAITANSISTIVAINIADMFKIVNRNLNNFA